MLAFNLLRPAFPGNISSDLQRRCQLHPAILLQRQANRTQHPHTHYAPDDAVSRGLQSLLGQYGKFERILFALSFVFYPTGRQNCQTTANQQAGLDSQYYRPEEKTLRSHERVQKCSNRRKAQQRTKRTQRSQVKK